MEEKLKKIIEKLKFPFSIGSDISFYDGVKLLVFTFDHSSKSVFEFCLIDCPKKMAELRPLPLYLCRNGYQQHIAARIYNEIMKGKTPVDALYEILFPNEK